MQWISVRDELPDLYQYSLVCAQQSGTGEPSTISIARYRGKEWEMLSTQPHSNAIACGDLTWYMEAEEITHWMPLPGPPDKI